MKTVRFAKHIQNEMNAPNPQRKERVENNKMERRKIDGRASDDCVAKFGNVKNIKKTYASVLKNKLCMRNSKYARYV